LLDGAKVPGGVPEGHTPKFQIHLKRQAGTRWIGPPSTSRLRTRRPSAGEEKGTGKRIRRLQIEASMRAFGRCSESHRFDRRMAGSVGCVDASKHDQPRDQRGVPHVAGAQLVPAPYGGWERHQIKNLLSTSEVVPATDMAPTASFLSGMDLRPSDAVLGDYDPHGISTIRTIGPPWGESRCSSPSSAPTRSRRPARP
jgi:hypothetical protein